MRGMRAARFAVSVAYWLGWFVTMLIIGAWIGGVSTTVVTVWTSIGAALCLGALLAERRRCRRLVSNLDGPQAISDPRTARQLWIQRGLAIAGGMFAAALLFVGDRETDAGQTEIARLRETGVATVGRVVDTRAEHWWLRRDADEVTVAYTPAGASVERRARYDVNSLDQYPPGREVEVIYDPVSGHAVIDGRGFGVGEGPMGFVGLMGGVGVAAIVAYQLNNVRRVSRIVRGYPWITEQVDMIEQQPGRLGITRMYVSVNKPTGRGRVWFRLATGFGSDAE
jgi:hypothetical protein